VRCGDRQTERHKDRKDRTHNYDKRSFVIYGNCKARILECKMISFSNVEMDSQRDRNTDKHNNIIKILPP
jgi:hypothetical protein